MLAPSGSGLAWADEIPLPADRICRYAAPRGHLAVYLLRFSYAKVEVIHDRDLHLTNAYGENVAYVAPLEEWPQTDVQGMKERLALAHQATKATTSRKEAFDRFMAGCRPDPADALAALS